MLAKRLLKSVVGPLNEMIDRYVPIYLDKILCYGYQHQEIIVQWGSCLSIFFCVTNGVC